MSPEPLGRSQGGCLVALAHGDLSGRQPGRQVIHKLTEQKLFITQLQPPAQGILKGRLLVANMEPAGPVGRPCSCMACTCQDFASDKLDVALSTPCERRRCCCAFQRVLEELAKKQFVALVSAGPYEAAIFTAAPKPGAAARPDMLRPGLLLVPRA